MDLAALPAWLKTRRWFGGKSAQISGVRAVDEARLGDLRVVQLEVSYADRPPERYLLPMRGEALDEALDEAACRALLDVMREEREVKTRAGVLRGERFGDLDFSGAVRRLSAEQSNTSIVFGDKVILKLIRKLEKGRNPELEVGALLRKRGFRSTPELLGALTLQTDVESTVGVAHRFVKVESDGWSYVLEHLSRKALLDEVRDLGACVGELHMALADPEDPAFAPEPIGRDDLQRWTRTLLDELETTMRVAGEVVPGLPARRAPLRARIEKLASAEPSGVKLRQHGDLHLGQVLRSEGQWLIFDFEGEPARPLKERREKFAPWKDIAGMLRSFAYAVATAAKKGASVEREPIRKAFLDGYRSRAAPLLPRDDRLLDAFELEKLMYELRYEVGHRPDWIGIPAQDLMKEEP